MSFRDTFIHCSAYGALKTCATPDKMLSPGPPLGLLYLCQKEGMAVWLRIDTQSRMETCQRQSLSIFAFAHQSVKKSQVNF